MTQVFQKPGRSLNISLEFLNGFPELGATHSSQASQRCRDNFPIFCPHCFPDPRMQAELADVVQRHSINNLGGGSALVIMGR